MLQVVVQLIWLVSGLHAGQNSLWRRSVVVHQTFSTCFSEQKEICSVLTLLCCHGSMKEYVRRALSPAQQWIIKTPTSAAADREKAIGGRQQQACSVSSAFISYTTQNDVYRFVVIVILSHFLVNDCMVDFPAVSGGRPWCRCQTSPLWLMGGEQVGEVTTAHHNAAATVIRCCSISHLSFFSHALSHSLPTYRYR